MSIGIGDIDEEEIADIVSDEEFIVAAESCDDLLMKIGIVAKLICNSMVSKEHCKLNPETTVIKGTYSKKMFLYQFNFNFSILIKLFLTINKVIKARMKDVKYASVKA